MSKQLRLDVAQLTDVGRKRPHNEDNMAYVIPKDPQVMARKGALFIVADGMGGHAAGEVASEIAVDTVSKVYYQDDSEDVAVSLLHAIRRANTLIHQRAAENMMRSGMGTTCVAAVLRGGTAYIANVGDSRAYLVRKGMVKQVSQDHSWVEEQVRAGLLTRDQARSHAQRNVITRCLGTQAEVEIDVFTEHLEEGDSMVLCSDGLSGLIADEELGAIVDQYLPQESVYHLVERANENGGSDNITAVVIRIQEVGWDPPGTSTPHPVGVGGREADEDTAIIGQFRGSPLVGGLSSHAADGRAPGGSMRVTSGPLMSPGSITAPQPALFASRSRRNRLFYPTLALLVILVVALVGGGGYYILQLYRWQADVDTALTTANTLIRQADTEATKKPTDALQKLRTAQDNLFKVQKQGMLNADQSKQAETLLRNNLTTTVKKAITAYNQQALILDLPCDTTKSSSLNASSTGAQAISVVPVRNGQNKVLYALGNDHILYQLDDQQNLAKKITLPGDAQPLAMVGADTRLLVLARNPSNFVLYVVLPNGKGAANASTIDSKLTEGGQAPSLITASGNDVYVALTPSNGSGSAVLLNYTLDGDKFKGNVGQRTIALSTNLVSMAAFPQHQLFLLFEDGSVQSLLFDGRDHSAVSVVMNSQPPLATPLGVSAQNFKPETTVPTPSQMTGNLPVLSLPGASALAAGTVEKVSHLYLMDEQNHRVLDLVVASAQENSPPASPTPEKTATGGGAGAPVMLQVFQQYSSVDLLSGMKSIAVDPTAPGLYLLAQGAQSNTPLNLIAIDTRKTDTNTCSPA